MAIPTITSVTPGVVHTGGGTLVEVRGTGFQLPGPPPFVPGPLPAPAPTVRVFFGGVEAKQVRVASDTLLLVQSPARAAGVVELAVCNVGRFGETLGVERAVLPNALTFSAPSLLEETHLEALVRTLILSLQAQVYQEVVYTQHTDWRDMKSPETVAKKVVEAKLPSVILAGPQIRPSQGDRAVLKEERFRGGFLEDGTGVEERPQEAKDLVFTLGCIANHPRHLLGLVTSLETYVERNLVLEVPLDAKVPTGAKVAYSFGYEGSSRFSVDADPNSSNIMNATASVVVYAVHLGELAGLPGDAKVDLHPRVEGFDVGFYQLHGKP